MSFFNNAFRRFSQGYTQFIEKHGLGLVIAACVAVIAGTAIWTNDRLPSVPEPPVLPTGETISAAELMQQSLADVTDVPASPAPAADQFQLPLSKCQVMTPFDAARLQASGVSGIWRLHDATDLAADAGEIVSAMADGTVSAVGTDSVLGTYLIIDHGNDISATYAGLAGIAGLKEGDPVRKGQTIGFAGNSVLDETDLPPHLHLRVTRGGKAFDPVSLFNP